MNYSSVEKLSIAWSCNSSNPLFNSIPYSNLLDNSLNHFRSPQSSSWSIYSILEKIVYTSERFVYSSIGHRMEWFTTNNLIWFSFACMELITWQQHALLISYFLWFAVQSLLFVLPSKSLSKRISKNDISQDESLSVDYFQEENRFLLRRLSTLSQ